MHPEDRVLVAVMNNRGDFQRARDEGWYRVPVRHAPSSVKDHWGFPSKPRFV